MDSLTTEAFTLLGIGVATIGIRTYARWSAVGFRGFKPDDYLMLVAAVVYSLETAAAYIVGAWWHGLANNGMTDQQRSSLQPHSQEWNLRIGGSKTQLVGWSLYTLLLWLLKFCMCFFYSRLTDGIDEVRGRIRIGFAILGATYVAVELSILLGCHPFSNNWRISPNPGNYCQPAISKIDLYVTVVLNVLTDAYLMSIPLPILYNAHLPPFRKALLLLIFSGGFFVMAAALLRCVLILRDPIHGAQAAGSWAVRETFVAVIIGNIPMIYPLVRKTFREIAPGGLCFSQGSTLPVGVSPSWIGAGSGGERGEGAGVEEGGGVSGGEREEGRGRFGWRRKWSGGRTLYPLTTTGGSTLAGSAWGGEEVKSDGAAAVGQVVPIHDGDRTEPYDSQETEGITITVATETIVEGVGVTKT